MKDNHIMIDIETLSTGPGSTIRGIGSVKTEEFRLPTHWMPYLLYGDASGMSDDEADEVSAWEVMHAPGPCIGVADDADFDEGPGGCERCTFTFQVIEPVLSDGEVIAFI